MTIDLYFSKQHVNNAVEFVVFAQSTAENRLNAIQSAFKIE